MDLVFEIKDTQIYFNPGCRTLHIKWHDHDRQDFQMIYLEILKALRRLTLELDVEGWLSDLSKCRAVETGEMQENLEHLVNALTESKLKRYARVTSKDSNYENDIQDKIDRFNATYKLGLAVGHFNTEPEALAWLFHASEGTLVEN